MCPERRPEASRYVQSVSSRCLRANDHLRAIAEYVADRRVIQALDALLADPGLLQEYSRAPNRVDGDWFTAHGIHTLAVDRDHDFLDEAAQELFAFAVSGRTRPPNRLEVGTCSSQPGYLFIGEWSPLTLSEASQLALSCCQLSQLLLPLTLQRSRHQPVLGFAEVELTAGSFSLEARLFNEQLPLLALKLSGLLRLPKRTDGRLQAGRRQCLQEGVD